MIVKAMSSNGDFSRKLMRRLVTSLSMLLLGVLSLTISLTLLPGSGLPDFVRGFYGGVSGGMIGAGCAIFIYTLWLRAHPCAAKKVEIKENDEREKAIAKGAMQATFGILYFSLAAALLIIAPINLTVFFTLFAVLMFNLVTFCIALVVNRFRL